MALNSFTKSYNHHHSLPLKHFHRRDQKPRLSCRNPQCPLSAPKASVVHSVNLPVLGSNTICTVQCLSLRVWLIGLASCVAGDPCRSMCWNLLPVEGPVPSIVHTHRISFLFSSPDGHWSLPPSSGRANAAVDGVDRCLSGPAHPGAEVPGHMVILRLTF